MKRALYKELALLVTAIDNCEKSKNASWQERHATRLEMLVRNHMPHGAGIDTGTKFRLDLSSPNKLVFAAPFHHMDENGGYYGWTKHNILVYPDLLSDIRLSISGPNRNDIKEYLHETFFYALTGEIDV